MVSALPVEVETRSKEARTTIIHRKALAVKHEPMWVVRRMHDRIKWKGVWSTVVRRRCEPVLIGMGYAIHCASHVNFIGYQNR